MNHPYQAPAPARHLSIVILLLGVMCAAIPATAGNNDAIAISANAIPEYVRPLDANGRPRAETYAFTEGVHIQGDTKDRSEERMTFDEITRTLAGTLAKQNYYPATDVTSVNLLIRVYWGTTRIYEDPQRDQNIERLSTARANMQASADAGTPIDLAEMRSAQDDSAYAANSTAGAIERNARLLGYKLSLLKEEKNTMASVREQTMRMELAEERYFVVLMAYDYQLIRREKKPKLLWVTRLSIRGPGNNFTEAMPALAIAGGDIFGQNLEGMKRIKVRDLPGGTVKLHELQVLGTADANAAEARDKAGK
jgi:hypothetical protein